MKIDVIADFPSDPAEGNRQRAEITPTVVDLIDPRLDPAVQADSLRTVITDGHFVAALGALMLMLKLAHRQAESHFGQPQGYYAEVWRTLAAKGALYDDSSITAADVDPAQVLAAMGYTDSQIDLIAATQNADPDFVGEPGEPIPALPVADPAGPVDYDDPLAMAERAHNGSSSSGYSATPEMPGVAGMQAVSVTAEQAELLSIVDPDEMQEVMGSAIRAALAELADRYRARSGG